MNVSEKHDESSVLCMIKRGRTGAGRQISAWISTEHRLNHNGPTTCSTKGLNHAFGGLPPGDWPTVYSSDSRDRRARQLVQHLVWFTIYFHIRSNEL